MPSKRQSPKLSELDGDHLGHLNCNSIKLSARSNRSNAMKEKIRKQKCMEGSYQDVSCSERSAASQAPAILMNSSSLLVKAMGPIKEDEDAS